MFTIRLAKMGDKEALRELFAAVVGRQPWNEADWNYALETKGVVVAAAGETIIGFGGIDVHAEVHLKWLYVLSGYQRNGIGSEILQRLENLGWESHLLSIRVHSTPEAVDFFSEKGFIPDKRASARDHKGIGMIKHRPHVLLDSVTTRFAKLAALRDAFLVMAGIFYLFGYLVWAINANQNKLGLLPALEFQYFVAGIVPVALILTIALLIMGYVRLRSRLHIWLGPRVTGKWQLLRRFLSGLWIVSLVFLFITFTDWFERVSGDFFARWRLGVLPFVVFALLTALLPPLDQREITGDSWRANLRRIEQSVLSFKLLGWVYAVLFLILFPLLGFLFFVQKVYPKIPQEFGGSRPRPACLDLLRPQLSGTTIADLAAAGSPADGTVVRSSQVEVLFSGSGVVVVRKDNRVYELTKSAVLAMTNCD